MSIGDPYATLGELKGRISVDDVVDDTRMTDALKTASAGIQLVCHRQFNTDASPAVRLVSVTDTITNSVAYVDDFHTSVGLVIETDDDNDGVFETTWTAAQYQLEPLNGVVNGEPSWPYTRIRAVDTQRFPRPSSGRASLRVTARWGWATVPPPVKEACLIVAEEVFKLKDAPFGVAGFGEYGAVRVRENPIAMAKLEKYVRTPILVA